VQSQIQNVGRAISPQPPTGRLLFFQRARSSGTVRYGPKCRFPALLKVKLTKHFLDRCVWVTHLTLLFFNLEVNELKALGDGEVPLSHLGP
jgi:hypothetical protein